MNAHQRLQRALQRIAAATSIVRTRSEDADRGERNGDLAARLDDVVIRFERLADELEKTLA